MRMIAALVLAATFHMPVQKSDAVIGVAAIHLESGRRLSVRGKDCFPMGSVYKFPIALTVLRKVDDGALSLRRQVTIEPKDFAAGWSPLRDQAEGRAITLTVEQLLRHMVSISDNTASDALLRIVGGAPVVTTRMADLGFGGVRVDRSETQMAADLSKPNGKANYAIDMRDTSTPEDMVALLFAFWRGRDGLSHQSHDLLVKLMTETATGMRRIKSAVPQGATVTHKTGTMPGTHNDVAVITSPDGANHIAIAIFTKAASSKSEDCEDDIAAVARGVYEVLMPKE
jgi:beta-lactamase class A